MHRIKMDGTPVQVVDQPAWRGDDDLRLFLQLIQLLVDILTAINGRNPDVG